MNTNNYSALHECSEWRFYANSDIARDNSSHKYFSIALDEDRSCYGGTRDCDTCYFDSACIINMKDLGYSTAPTGDDYISITPTTHPELFI